MVRYNQAYKGSQHVAYIYKNGKIVKKIYKGSTLIYQLGFEPVTFNVSSSLQTFNVPLGVSKIHVDCVASKGQNVTYNGYTGAGGKGGRVQCDLAVNGGESLYIMVGDIPSSGANPLYNASDIRLGGNTLNDRIIVAGGGGSGTVSSAYGAGVAQGGAGGNTTGANGALTVGYGNVATGGSQTAGGVGAHNSVYGSLDAGAGQFGLGGTGATGGNAVGGIPGAGGAGYYGGGGGINFGVYFGSSQFGSWAYSGAGGSSYTNSNCSNVTHTQGYQDGAGYVTISFVE